MLSEIEFTFVRSSGPGGQNVNKVNSKAVLKWNIIKSTAIRESVKQRFIERYASKISSAGDVVLSCDSFRNQLQNKAHCIQILKDMIASVAVAPKKRVKTKPTRASEIRRRTDKKKRSEKKKWRAD